MVVTINNLNKDQYELLNQDFNRWMEEYGEQLDEEFGDPNESNDEGDENE